MSVFPQPTKKDSVKIDVSPYGEPVDDIGLETNVGTAALHRTCDEPPIPQEPFAPEDAPTKVESDLRTIIAVWQRLSDSTRRMIMNTVKEEIDSLHSST